MIGKVSNVLTGSQGAVVQSIKNTQRLLDKAQLRLASGKDVNSAIDNPSNFFTSVSLSQKADDLRRLLDGISLNIEAIKTASAGAQGILNLIDSAEALLNSAIEELYSSESTSLVAELSDENIAAILAANPGLSYSSSSKISIVSQAIPRHGLSRMPMPKPRH